MPHPRPAPGSTVDIGQVAEAAADVGRHDEVAGRRQVHRVLAHQGRVVVEPAVVVEDLEVVPPVGGGLAGLVVDRVCGGSGDGRVDEGAAERDGLPGGGQRRLGQLVVVPATAAATAGAAKGRPNVTASRTGVG